MGKDAGGDAWTIPERLPGAKTEVFHPAAAEGRDGIMIKFTFITMEFRMSWVFI